MKTSNQERSCRSCFRAEVCSCTWVWPLGRTLWLSTSIWWYWKPLRSRLERQVDLAGLVTLTHIGWSWGRLSGALRGAGSWDQAPGFSLVFPVVAGCQLQWRSRCLATLGHLHQGSRGKEPNRIFEQGVSSPTPSAKVLLSLQSLELMHSLPLDICFAAGTELWTDVYAWSSLTKINYQR